MTDTVRFLLEVANVISKQNLNLQTILKKSKVYGNIWSNPKSEINPLHTRIYQRIST